MQAVTGDDVPRLRAPRRAGAVVALLALVVAGVGGRPARAQQQALEYEVKAAFLYNFINFVTWPANSFTGPSDPLALCVYGPDPFGRILDRTIDGGTSGDRPLVIERIRDEGSIDHCDAVFVPVAAAGRASSVMRAASMKPILMIGESPDFLSKGGMINFVLESGRVRFDINAEAASARGLSISSRLLRVARNAAAFPGAGDR
jgi:hypothetical protein